jgi:uncharacterized protein (TIGR04222 family)
MQLFSSWTGSDFLLFYSALLAGATAAAWWLPAQIRESGRRGDSQDLESVALLAGGRERLAESLLADLYVRGALAMADKGRLTVAQPRIDASPAARTLLASSAPITLADAKRLVAIHAERAAVRLRRSGLMLRAEDYARLRWLSVAPFGMLLMIGAYRQRAGSAMGEPTEFLIILMILTVVLAVIRFASSDPRTASGIAAVRQMREANGRFARAPRPEEVGMAVALFGTGVLVGTPWEPVHALKQKDGDSGGGDGGSDGGSGCGGCGGCGG